MLPLKWLGDGKKWVPEKSNFKKMVFSKLVISYHFSNTKVT
jgi:hypothetical protein